MIRSVLLWATMTLTHGTTKDCTSLLGLSVDNAQSSGWVDGSMNSFSIRFAILNWVHGVRVHIHWPGDVIAVDKVYEAMLISSKGGESNVPTNVL